MDKTQGEQDLKLVIAGHVDHGKSTIIGRMLADTDSLPEGKLEQVKETCRRNSKPFEYAFLLDALKDEQSQGITIDSARVFFQTDYRQYIILDAPGHIEFLKNMVTGAAHAEAALLVIDAEEGVQENSRRHGYMISMLGIKQMAVIVNKMDLVDYDQQTYENIVEEYTEFLKEINIEPMTFLPVSGFYGDNVAEESDNMDWYQGQTVLELLDSFENEALPHNKPFRMPVQDVYKFTKGGDDRRIIAGTAAAGELNVGDEVVFYPSGKKSTVKTIEGFKEPEQHKIRVGKASGFTLDEQIYITRGEVAARCDEAEPEVSARIEASLFWLNREPLVKDKVYELKLGTSRAKARLEKINRVIDASNLDQDEEIVILDSSQNVYNHLKQIKDYIKEHFIGLYLNARSQLLHQETVSVGTLNASLIHPRECFEPAIKYHAANVVFAYNYPSGSLEKSSEDIRITQKLVAAGDLLGIKVVDHVIISKEGFISFKQKGWL